MLITKPDLLTLARDLFKYGLVGVLNTLVSLTLFNALIFGTGISTGWPVTLFTLAAFAAGITHSFFWSKYWIFKRGESGRGRSEYPRFFLVTTAMAVLGSGFVYVLTTHVAPPYGMPAELWANIAILLFFPISLVGSYSGSRLFVFNRPI